MRQFFVLICMMFCMTAFSSCQYQPSSIQITEENGEIVIHSGNHEIHARRVGEKRSAKFLLVGGTGRGMYPFTAHFSAVSMAQLERLERGYGSIEQCQKEGVLESPDSAKSMFLYAIHESIAKVLRKADGLAMTWNHPLVRMTFIELKVTKHIVKVMDREIQEDPEAYQPSYLVLNIEIIDDNYQ